MTTYTARWIFPVTAPPLEHGTITVDGERIVAVEAAGMRRADVDLGNVAIIPGLVNAHTHLDLSGARCVIPPTSPVHFCEWLLNVIAYRRNRTAEGTLTDIQAGIDECMNYGVTLVGDIASGGVSAELLERAAIHATVYYERIGLSPVKQLPLEEETSWRQAPSKCIRGTSPHAPFSAGPILCNAPVQVPKSIHLAESPAERLLLQSRTGPFVDFLKRLNVYEGAEFIDDWQSCLDANRGDGCGPVAWVHCNYLPTETRFADNHTIVFCPRTHAAFGHPRHPFPHFLARGVRVVLGTDSLASNPDLDLFTEAQCVHRDYPEVNGAQILRMATLAGAEALGWAADCGSLQVDKLADFTVIALPNVEHADAYETLFQTDASLPRRTLFRGEWRLS